MSYLKMLGLTKEPFKNSEDSDFFAKQLLGEAYATIQASFAQQTVVSLVVGETGVGKSALLNHLHDSALNDWRLERLSLKPNSHDEEILEQLLGQFQVVVNKEMDHRMYRQQMLSALAMRFNELAMFKLLPIIFVDNAEYLDRKSLKTIFALNDLNKDAKGKLKIVLFAQPELMELLRVAEFKDYHDRVGLIALNNLHSNQVSEYLSFRLSRAGLKQNFPFDDSQIEMIYAQSQGNPALINNIADQELLKKTKDFSALFATEKNSSNANQSLADKDNYSTNKGAEEEMTYPGNDSKSDIELDDLTFSTKTPMNSFEEIQSLADDLETENELSKDDLTRQLEQELAESQQFLKNDLPGQRFLTPKFLIPGLATLFILLSGATFFLLMDDNSENLSSQPQLTSQPLLLPEENVPSEKVLDNQAINSKNNAFPGVQEQPEVVARQAQQEGSTAVAPEQEIKKIPLIFLEDDLLEVVEAEKGKTTALAQANSDSLRNTSPAIALDSTSQEMGIQRSDNLTQNVTKTGGLIPETDKPLAVDFSHTTPQLKPENPASSGDNLSTEPTPNIVNITPIPVIGTNKRQSIAINGTKFTRETQLILNWNSAGKKKEKVFSARLTPSQFKFENSKRIRLFVNTGTDAGTWQVQAVNSGNAHSSIIDFQVVAPFKKIISKSKQTLSKPTTKKDSRENYILRQADNHYTIQLLSSSNLQAVKELTKKHKIANKSSIFTITRNGKKLYSLVYGSFKDKKAAATAYKRLPKALSSNRLWARKIAEVKKLVQQSQLLEGVVKGNKVKTFNSKKSHPGFQNKKTIGSRDPKLWTFQLISLGSASDMDQYIKNNKLEDKALFFKRVINGKPLYTLIYGTYSSRQKALDSIQSLPKNIRVGKPWVRQYADIQALMK